MLGNAETRLSIELEKWLLLNLVLPTTTIGLGQLIILRTLL